MKTILIALIVVGITNFSADAQAKKSSANQNYKVCLNNGTYNICGKEGTSRAGTSNRTRISKMHNMDKQAWTTPMAEPAEPIAMNTVNSYEGFYRRHNIVVSDDMHKPYEGEASRQYDGPAKNEERNLNVNQTSIYLPPNSGGIEGRR
ncbi:MAG: hypothetical protein P4L41_02720 [Flavipsychrobacter sp.]|nr:hypothetical protein [Flavipsychrobacter sp.]